MNVKDGEIPERLRALPRDHRGYPIFFTIQNHRTGEHSFLAMVSEQVAACIKMNLCGLCGQPNAYWLWFAGGPVSCGNRVFSDPPMHKSCLDYACKVCPFIVSRDYRRIENRPDRPAHIDDEHGVPYEAKEFGLFRTRSYKYHIEKNGMILFLAAPAKEIIWLERGKSDV